MKRTLTLKSETLAELSADDLSTVVGGKIITAVSCPLRDCLESVLICYSWACPTEG